MDVGAREDFSSAMLKNNRFIFNDNPGLVPKVSRKHDQAVASLILSTQVWRGMWKASFVLQTFASHLNFTHGRVEIPFLQTEQIGARAAFALAVTGVY